MESNSGSEQKPYAQEDVERVYGPEGVAEEDVLPFESADLLAGAVFSVALVTTIATNKTVSRLGTGFFVSLKDIVYFITCHHVLFGEESTGE